MEFNTSNVYKQGLFNFSSPLPSPSIVGDSSNLVNIHKRNPENVQQNPPKRKRIVIQKNNTETEINNKSLLNTSTKEYITMVFIVIIGYLFYLKYVS